MIKEEKTYQAYYTKSEPIVNYMVRQLDLQAGERLLEPCGGDGVFVDKIATLYPAVLQDVFEMNPDSFAYLENKYRFQPNIQVRQTDTLLDEDLSFRSKFGGDYDKVIANPPYGAWQTYEKRDLLKKHFPGLYVKETYALFLFRCISLLKEGGKLVFIIPDTFLNLHLHKNLREFLLTHTKIENIDLFPSSFFPNVNFGYANLCIISLEKCSNKNHCFVHSFAIRQDFEQVKELGFRETGNAYFLQKEIYSNEDHAFLIKDKTTAHAIRYATMTIGDVADCVTGFYSGNDKVFLKTNSVRHRNAKNYQLITAPEIAENFNSHPNILEGISDEDACFIPIVKGGGIRFCKSDDWFINWSEAAVRHYKADKKARFQNPRFYFRQGIAVPMVSSSSISASLVENRIFDQSIVGVFPKEERLVWFLLAFFNSPTANDLIRTINPSTNNSANYIKKLPFILPSENILLLIEQLTKEIFDERKISGTLNTTKHQAVNELIAETYSINHLN